MRRFLALPVILLSLGLFTWQCGGASDTLGGALDASTRGGESSGSSGGSSGSSSGSSGSSSGASSGSGGSGSGSGGSSTSGSSGDRVPVAPAVAAAPAADRGQEGGKTPGATTATGLTTAAAGSRAGLWGRATRASIARSPKAASSTRTAAMRQLTSALSTLWLAPRIRPALASRWAYLSASANKTTVTTSPSPATFPERRISLLRRLLLVGQQLGVVQLCHRAQELR
jgi:hypothetical protein